MNHFANLHHCQLSQWIYEKCNRTQVALANPWFVILHFQTHIWNWVSAFFDRVFVYFFRSRNQHVFDSVCCDLWYHWGYQRILMNCGIADEKRISGTFRVDRVTCQHSLSRILSIRRTISLPKSIYSFRGKKSWSLNTSFSTNSMNETVRASSAVLNYPFVMWTKCHAIFVVCICHGSVLLDCTWFNKRNANKEGAHKYTAREDCFSPFATYFFLEFISVQLGMIHERNSYHSLFIKLNSIG